MEWFPGSGHLKAERMQLAQPGVVMIRFAYFMVQSFSSDAKLIRQSGTMNPKVELQTEGVTQSWGPRAEAGRSCVNGTWAHNTHKGKCVL